MDGYQRAQKNVDVVRHDDPGVEVVEVPLSHAGEEDLAYAFGDLALS